MAELRKFLSKGEVQDLTGLSSVCIWNWQRAGTFPRAYQLGPARIGFDAAEIAEWMATRPIAKIKGDPSPDKKTARPRAHQEARQ